MEHWGRKWKVGEGNGTLGEEMEGRGRKWNMVEGIEGRGRKWNMVEGIEGRGRKWNIGEGNRR